MKSSRFVAKLVSRLFLLLLLLAIVPLFQADRAKLHSLYFVTAHKWILIFPCILVGGFLTLFIGCTIQKYTKPDWNWLLVVNTIVLMAYCATIYIKVLQLIR
jgi:hypothetical protein